MIEGVIAAVKETDGPVSADQQHTLNEDQRRALSTRMGMLDRQLYDAEMLLTNSRPHGAMFEITNDLSDEQIHALLHLLVEAREHVRELRDRFGLEVQREDLRQRLAGRFGILWAILEDSHAVKLKGFGEVSDDLSGLLDPEVNALIEIVNQIKSHVKL